MLWIDVCDKHKARTMRAFLFYQNILFITATSKHKPAHKIAASAIFLPFCVYKYRYSNDWRYHNSHKLHQYRSKLSLRIFSTRLVCSAICWCISLSICLVTSTS